MGLLGFLNEQHRGVRVSGFWALGFRGRHFGSGFGV